MEIEKTLQAEVASRREARRDVFKNLAFILIAVGVAYLIIVSIGVEGLERFVDRAGVWGLAAVIALKMTTIIVVPLSGGPIYAIAGAAFGFWPGLVLTFVGDVLGFSAAFFLSRFFGRPIINVFVPRAQAPFIEKMLIHGSELPSFLKARLAFTGFPEVFAYAAGLTKIPFLVFITAQMVLHIPVAALIVFFGDALLTSNPAFFAIAAVAAVILALIGGWWFKRDLTQAA